MSSIKWYTKEHEWIMLDADQAVVGITVYAAKALGDITFIELPTVGARFSQMQRMATVESIKAASDIYAPVSGTVSEVNKELETRPEIIGESAEENGWICKFKNIDQAQCASLMNKEQYQAYVASMH